MNIELVTQGTPEWKAIRCGRVTASRVADIVARTKTGPSASRANYLAELVAERLTGTVAEGYSNSAMEWGTTNEADARLAYSFRADADVEEVGFVHHPSIPMAGASPDGLVSTDGLVEIKCPNTATHIDTLLSGSVPGKYITQMQWQMACTGRLWCDFASFDPRMPEEMRLFVKRVERDEPRITELETEVRTFLTELDATIGRLTASYGIARAA
jgi:putative phage-type endonuclease